MPTLDFWGAFSESGLRLFRMSDQTHARRSCTHSGDSGKELKGV